MNKTAMITGITGQDGSYLAEFLLNKGYSVVGLARRSSTDSFQNIQHILDRIDCEIGDITDSSFISGVIGLYRPDEFYNLGAQSFVPVSWKMPKYTAEVNAIGPLTILDVIRRISPNTRFYQASTSEMFGKVREIPQNEDTPFYPRSPYGVAKIFGHWITVNYRESYNLFASSGILFNHESPRRGMEFVTRKITSAVARIHNGRQRELLLGNLDSKRDWGHAADYVEAMWLILQHYEPDTFVIGSDQTHSVREFCDCAFKCVNLDYRDFVKVDENLFRPAEVDILLSDSSKARSVLGWKPRFTFENLVEHMVHEDLYLYEKEMFNELR